MLSKFSVLQVSLSSLPPVRHLGGLTPLEKFERLRKLCCTSDIAKKRADVENALRPRTQEVEDVSETKADCVRRPKELLDVRGKTAMILGGASGIGFETANSLLQCKVLRVIIADINQCAGVDATKKLCTTYGSGRAYYLMTDIRQQPSIEMAFKELYRYFNQLDIYVNCVGIYNETPMCWDKMINTNLVGCVRAMLLAYKYLSTNIQDECSQGSVIVNVSSYGSISTIPSMPMFSAASNGINGLTSSFGQDFHFSRSKVRCVTVCPSCTDSGLLKNMSVNHYNRLWASHSTAAMKCCAKQSAKFVGKAIANTIRFGLNGHVYVVKEGKYYRYAMPDYMKFMRQETVLW